MGWGTFVFWLSTVGHFNIMATKISRSELDLNKVTCDKSNAAAVVDGVYSLSTTYAVYMFRD